MQIESSQTTVRYQDFAEEIDRVRARVAAEIGPEDLEHVKRLNRFSRVMEITGRVLLHFGLGPLSFVAGVGCLWVHKQLQATEIGHTALHGAYDKLPGVGRFHSEKFRWDVPIDEESWRKGHNVRHHVNTNVAGRDPDIHFGPARLTAQTPWAPRHKWQLPFMVGVLAPNFGFLMNFHFTGLHDVLFGNGLEGNDLDVLPDRSKESRRLAYRRALRKWVPYYAYNYLLFPLLAGPNFLRVLTGNWIVETLRDLYSAATIYCGHVGEDVASWPVGTRTRGKGEWYAMQVMATNNFEVERPISILCGGLDFQIEHHLFPHFPPERLRQVAPEVRAICIKYGVPYKTASWGATLKKALAWVGKLASPGEMIRAMA